MAARVKHKIDLKHETNAQELIFSLSKMQSWLEILIANQENDYNDFSKWLLTDGFVSNLLKRMSIMQMAKEFGHSNAPKITKWLYEIYDDIFNLHLEKPELFTTGNGIAQRYFVSENETYANLYYCLPVIPRKYEEIRIPFLKAKFGIDFFWVCKVDYEFHEEGMDICVWLKGGFPNTYREQLYQRAEFERSISWMDLHHLHETQVDDKLLELYRKL